MIPLLARLYVGMVTSKHGVYEVPMGTWIQPAKRGMSDTCCQCGLEHFVEYRVRQGRVELRVWPMKRGKILR